MVQTENQRKREIARVFELQKDHQFAVAHTSVQERRRKLKRLQEAVLRYRDAFKEAIGKDFGKNPVETDLTEIYVLLHEIRHARRNLGAWMRPRRVATPLVLMGARSLVTYEPKGLTLIMGAWNYPVLLTLGPLVSAMAAGNCAILKPSEITPFTSAVIADLIRDTFEEREIAVMEGGPGTGSDLLEMPFNHIFFTGSTRVGKIVMGAAARQLASVTLEMGGKSPVVVDDTASIPTAAEKLCWGKFLNAGQTCIAPDYVWVHTSKMDAFLEAFQKEITKRYGPDPKASSSFARIVNEAHTKRLAQYLDEALQAGGKIRAGGAVDVADRYVAPTLLTDVPLSASIMQEEIFGPLLPVFPYSDLQEVIGQINSRPNPLSMYIFSQSRKNINRLISHTRVGGTCINNTLVQFFNPNLPFGGFNHSGIGNAHGFWGFQEFSNARAVLKQFNPGIQKLTMPPYGRFQAWLAQIAIRWF